MQGIGYKGAKMLRELKKMKVLSPGPGSCLCPGAVAHCPHAAQLPQGAETPNGDLVVCCPAAAAGSVSTAGAPGQQLPLHRAPASAGGTARGKSLSLLLACQSPIGVSYWLPVARDPGKCYFQI